MQKALGLATGQRREHPDALVRQILVAGHNDRWSGKVNLHSVIPETRTH